MGDRPAVDLAVQCNILPNSGPTRRHYDVAKETFFTPDYASQVRAFGQTLAHTERLSLEQLQAYQAPLVARLLAHARKTTKFYRDRLDFDLKSHKEINESWSAIPILSRAEAVKNYLKLTNRKPPPPEIGPVIEGRTSGSTGTPFRFKKNGASVLASAALTERLYRWWSVDGAKSLAFIAGISRLPPDEFGGLPPSGGIQAIQPAYAMYRD